MIERWLQRRKKTGGPCFCQTLRLYAVDRAGPASALAGRTGVRLIHHDHPGGPGAGLDHGLDPVLVERRDLGSREEHVERDAVVDPDGVTAAAELGGHGPGEEEVLAPAELGADRDLHVEEQAVVEFVAFAVVAEGAHGVPFGIVMYRAFTAPSSLYARNTGVS